MCRRTVESNILNHKWPICDHYSSRKNCRARARLDRRREKKKTIWILKTNLRIERLRHCAHLNKQPFPFSMAHVDAFVLRKNEFMLVEVTRAVCTVAYVLSHSNRILISSSIILIIVLSRLFFSPVCSSHRLSLL